MRRYAPVAAGLLASCGGAASEGARTDAPLPIAASQERGPAHEATGPDLTATQLMPMWDQCRVELARKQPEWSGAFVAKACSCAVDRARALSRRGEDWKVPPDEQESERCLAHARDTETAVEMVPSPFAKGLLHATESLVGGYLACFQASVAAHPGSDEVAHRYCFCLVEAMHTSTETVKVTFDRADPSCRQKALASSP